MSPAEEWKIVLSEEGAGGGTPKGAGTGGAGAGVTGSKTWGDIGKVAGAVAGVSSGLALVIQAVRRSKIFSTWMDTFLTILGAMVDMLLIPLIPVLFPVLTQLAKFMKAFKTTGDIIKMLFPDDWSEQLLNLITAGMGASLKNFIEWLIENFPKVWKVISDSWDQYIAKPFLKWITDIGVWWDINVSKPFLKWIADVGVWWDANISKPFKVWIDSVGAWWKTNILDPLKQWIDSIGTWWNNSVFVKALQSFKWPWEGLAWKWPWESGGNTSNTTNSTTNVTNNNAKNFNINLPTELQQGWNNITNYLSSL